MGFQPERAGGGKRIDSRIPPPRLFITAAMDFPMVRATYWHSPSRERYAKLFQINAAQTALR